MQYITHNYTSCQVTLDTLNDFKKETNSPQYKINEKILAHQGERLSLAKVVIDYQIAQTKFPSIFPKEK